jgi:N-acetyl sugar amidotransferase
VTIKYRMCNRCVLDTTATEIEFDEKGFCNYCTKYLNKAGERKSRYNNVTNLVKKIKDTGRGSKYDCIFGLSGGLDSTWGLKVLVEQGLRPLVVHMDNGWNSELAQNNIHNIVEKLNVELHTHVISWSEYRDLMQSFFDADVIDIELLMDQAFTGALYKQARRYKVKYILTGQNTSNEGMGMPKGWNWYKNDKSNILDIWKKYGKLKKIKTFPFFGTFEWLYCKYIKKIEWIRFLDYFEFNDDLVKEILVKDYDYKLYKFKHGESIFTKFYQGYILPKKFNVDKRKLHLSTKILSGQITRESVLLILKEEPYHNKMELSEDIDYVSKKMMWTDSYLHEYIKRPPVGHAEYKTETRLLAFMLRVKAFIWRYLRVN